ncbi:MAG: beta-ketoacyl-[acyl-carrier-protein] synthase family protein [Bacteroides sp.]|nr:beta-ketoacyl-[acyl-carrier-protein] synthase family protein [Bacteroides sp.]
MKDARINHQTIDKSQAGVCISSAISNMAYCEDVFFGEETTESQNIYKKGLYTHITCEIADEFDFQGENLIMSTGCTGGIDAIGYAYEAIKYGDQHLMICGAVETPVSKVTIGSFEAIGALTKTMDKESAREASRPFDKTRNGFVLAEGCAVLILEEYENAICRGAHIYAEIKAYNSCNNAYHMTDLPNNGVALGELLIQTMKEAEVQPSDIDYLNAHSSSTPQNDLFEAAAYHIAFKEHVKSLPVSSTKSMTGHPLGASSAIEIVHTVLAMKNNTIPPTANYKVKDEECDINIISTPTEQTIDTTISNANGFSGLHGVLILSKI